MECCSDIVKARAKAIKAIKKYGFSPEHNYYNYLYLQTADRQCLFFDYGKGKGIIAFHNKKNGSWRVINGIFAPPKERLSILLKFIDWAIKEKKSKKIFVEAQEEFKSDVFKRLRNSFKLNAIYSLHWPVFNLDALDEKLSGKQWKKLRNIRNRYCKNFKIEVKNPIRVKKAKLKSILMHWTKKRYPRDRANYAYYLNIIENNFKGMKVKRAISLDGETCSFSAGWKIPNSAVFYSGVGIFNYKHKDLGDFINLDDLLHLKKLGYRHVDLGGSEKSLLHFKKKFNPVKIYKTCFFSISTKMSKIFH